MTDKKIGLFIQGGHLLSNGITQQGHYTKLALEACGYTVDLISTVPIPSYVELGHTVYIVGFDSDMSDYSTIIFVSATLCSSDEKNKVFLQNAKNVGVKFVNLICGNIFYLYQEEIIFDVHHILKSNENSFIDEVWVLPMYTYSIDMLETFFKKPVKVAPYIWNSDILKHICKDQPLPFFDANIPNDNVTVFCAEPNMSVHKNAFVPILISESYYTKFNKLNSMCILCGNKLHIQALKVYMNFIKHGKLELYDRIPFVDILHQSKIKNIQFPSIVSHQYLNDLNFVHFEALYLGWPLIHNCDRLINVGYFYNRDNVNEASVQMEYARLNHQKNHKQYMKRVEDFLESYNPRNEKVVNTYTNLINSLLSDNS